ncbi:D-aminoacyl-tRNA deacylase [Parasutterella secunda]|jgi:D-tyrosyl-tRNA(Tyr) deacylase|uniref:D-aminoacyl-tRNA deacylase n=1 Tax=Parasutterella secunda TaxID=626947 RepID=UPI001F9F6113|nr:D-aminoacyl-tRNA deacylase [Parasutterella secunda]MDM8112635.1 D-aminoacyl-tRNA deacylase [Parasutterella secunda]MDM8218352.1 D-aminoacyl-tRNA deacylase [Parasutterella secunda]MDM8225155.1 D-aminoacyl-tRNA deacylase [Parasutterella secunda]HIR20824.1 D-tyrosyl-tRNA(Tyr) deacylase [Candidatus Aphodousia faecalis]
MIGLLQRVKNASVTVNEQVIGAVKQGLLVLVCAEKGDSAEQCEKLAKKVLAYRIFEDENGKMNKSVSDIGGEILIVSQFTLAADTAKGLRPSFTPAADPETGKRLYEHFIEKIKESGLKTETGQFGANMQVALINDGPVTIWLKC